MTDPEKVAASLTELERILVEGTASGWGSWMWDVAGDLVGKGLMYNRGPCERLMTDLGLAVRAHLIEREGR